MFDIWNERNELAETVYNQDNFKIIEHDGREERVCVIYFSSNNIWFPNEEKDFRRALVDNNRYEWTNIRIQNARKEIFIRDIYKSWYVQGINININNIDKLIAFLKDQTDGYRVITIGSSAGGYMAALVAAKLKGDYALCFSPQFGLCNEYALDKNPLLQKYQNSLLHSQYYNIVSIINDSKVDIFYLCPIKNKSDEKQMIFVENLPNIHILKLSTSKHGTVLTKLCLKVFINISKEQLIKKFDDLQGKIVNPIMFSISIIGIQNTFKSICVEIINKIKLHWRT